MQDHPSDQIPSGQRPSRICGQCGKEFKRNGTKVAVYCSMACKAEYQRSQKPVDRDWLYQKYVVEGLTAPQIAKIVGRDPKGVWTWLRDLGIPTRPRGSYSDNWRQPGEPSSFKGKKHTPEVKAKIKELAISTGRVPYDPAVGSYMKGRKGAEVHNWKGGITPQRQAFYSSPEWKECVKAVWKRDNARCQRCGIRHERGNRHKFDIHHIVSFACVELRAKLDNLVLLCEPCHYWVHGAENINRDFIREMPDASS